MLNDRKKKILKAVVEEYINTAEPVASSNISKNYGLNISSATIRNEMAELEEEKYLEKTHTSSGRVPSDKGYRYYVDELLKENNITPGEMSYIKNRLETKINEIEDLTKITTSTLSEITHYTSVGIGNTIVTHNIADIKFILLGNRVLIAMILTDAGIIKETIIKFNADITEEQVKNINQIFNNSLIGKPLSKIDKPMEEYMVSEMKYELQIIKPIIEQINEAILKNTNIYLEGTNKSFDLPEFQKHDTAKNFLSLLDTKEMMIDLLNSDLENDINVYIGNENENEDLKDFSIVTFKNTRDGKDLGTIGIIGPKRMNYSKVISVIKYIQNKLKGGNGG